MRLSPAHAFVTHDARPDWRSPGRELAPTYSEKQSMTHKNTHPMTRLAAAITLCVAPTLALAGDKPMSGEIKDAYREG